MERKRGEGKVKEGEAGRERGRKKEEEKGRREKEVGEGGIEKRREEKRLTTNPLLAFS